MQLLIDIGNTRSKWVLRSESGLVHCRGYLSESSLFGGAQLALDLKAKIKQVWVSCVGKSNVLSAVTVMVARELGLVVQVASVESFAGELVNAYGDLGRLGVDRWMAAVGARSRIPEGGVIVVDAGTAVTIDYISSDSVFEGGVILPGLVMMHDSLVGNTVGIASEIAGVDSVIGKNTPECVNAGVLYGLVGAVERIVKEIISMNIDDSIRLMLCGGDAAKIQSLSDLPFELTPNVIFDGLQVMAKIKNNQ